MHIFPCMSVVSSGSVGESCSERIVYYFVSKIEEAIQLMILTLIDGTDARF